MRYVGWIKGEPSQRHALTSLGVEGKIRYNNGIFEYCNCSNETIKRLIKELPGFWAGCFTAMIGKKQAPREQQKYWKYHE